MRFLLAFHSTFDLSIVRFLYHKQVLGLINEIGPFFLLATKQTNKQTNKQTKQNKNKKHPNYSFFWSWLLTVFYLSAPPFLPRLCKFKSLDSQLLITNSTVYKFVFKILPIILFLNTIQINSQAQSNIELSMQLYQGRGLSVRCTNSQMFHVG